MFQCFSNDVYMETVIMLVNKYVSVLFIIMVNKYVLFYLLFCKMLIINVTRLDWATIALII